MKEKETICSRSPIHSRSPRHSHSRSPRHSLVQPKYRKRSPYRSDHQQGKYKVHQGKRLPRFDSDTKYKQDSDTSSSDSEKSIQKSSEVDINMLIQDLEGSFSSGTEGEIQEDSSSRNEPQSPKQTWHDIAQSTSDSDSMSEVDSHISTVHPPSPSQKVITDIGK